MSVQWKLDFKSEGHIKNRHGNGNRKRCNDRNYCQIYEDQTITEEGSQRPGSEDGKTSSGGEYMTREDREDAHFFTFVANNTKAYGHDKGKWRSRGELEIPR